MPLNGAINSGAAGVSTQNTISSPVNVQRFSVPGGQWINPGQGQLTSRIFEAQKGYR